ncbi:MAG TPA: TetR/AcrR family transcriptional regulator [Ktedonobacteraceae bacterium]|nr:TetR/AcrR family transcriptional regulator [Ktedonobacteraceae bacterium]
MKRERSASAPRLSAEERREKILDVAIPVFAMYGLHGASTLMIADDAGISETYIFRLFGTKKDLFLAAVERVHNQIMNTYRMAAETHPDRMLEVIRMAMLQAPVPQEVRLLLLQAYAACNDEDIQRVVRGHFREMYTYVAARVGAQEDVHAFFADTMLSMTTLAIGIPNLATLVQDEPASSGKET